MPIIHSPSPAPSTHPTGPAHGPRASPSAREMAARASARGVPPTAGVGCRGPSSASTSGAPGTSRPSMRVPRWATELKATRDGASGTRSSSQYGSQHPRDVVDHVAVLLSVLGRAGERALGVRVGARRVAPANGAGQRMAGDAATVAGDQELGRGAEERAVGDRHGEHGARGLGRPQPAQHGRERERAVERHGHRTRQHHLAQRGARGLHRRHGTSHLVAVGGRREGGGHARHRRDGAARQRRAWSRTATAPRRRARRCPGAPIRPARRRWPSAGSRLRRRARSPG